MTARWWFWSLPTATWKTGSSHPPPGQTPSSMREAANFLNALIEGRTLSELTTVMRKEIDRHGSEIDSLAAELVESGLALWDGQGDIAMSG